MMCEGDSPMAEVDPRSRLTRDEDIVRRETDSPALDEIQEATHASLFKRC
jgi:hypothetical protein